MENITNLIIRRNKCIEIGKRKRQRNMFQMKEQDKTQEEELSEVEISYLHDKEVKVMIMKMLSELGRRMNDHVEKLIKSWKI